jgi:hypothetical protein
MARKPKSGMALGTLVIPNFDKEERLVRGGWCLVFVSSPECLLANQQIQDDSCTAIS